MFPKTKPFMVSAFNILLVTMKILVSCSIHTHRFKADVTALILQTVSQLLPASVANTVIICDYAWNLQLEYREKEENRHLALTRDQSFHHSVCKTYCIYTERKDLTS